MKAHRDPERSLGRGSRGYKCFGEREPPICKHEDLTLVQAETHVFIPPERHMIKKRKVNFHLGDSELWGKFKQRGDRNVNLFKLC